MEIKITISDSAPGATAEGSSIQVSRGMSGPGSASTSGTASTAASPAASQTAAPPDLLQAAAAIGAINAGPAPNSASGSSLDGPNPYIGSGGGTYSGAPSGAATQINTESAGPAPGSSSSGSIDVTSAPEGTA